MTQTTDTTGSIDRAFDLPDGVEILGAKFEGAHKILSRPALEFIASLERVFGGRLRDLLELRAEQQAKLDTGARPDFLPETVSIRKGRWRVAQTPEDLQCRKVEITGPVERKMIVNALNSGADVFMADFEDSSAPTWQNMIAGQIHLHDAVRRKIDFVHPANGKLYELGQQTATLFVRPRGLHLKERHVVVDGVEITAALFDFGLYLFHNARELLTREAAPYFYLPKLENHHEARWWNDVFVGAQSALRVRIGTIRATVLIETVLAAFEMDEILYELRDHSAGLNCGRWDYIFSFIKCLGKDAAFVVPDRATVGMDRHFLRSYSQLLIQTCHRRGAHAIGGMAAQIPVKDDPDRNTEALAKVRADKRREVEDGHDGTWVAHPALIATAREEFDKLEGPNQLECLRSDVTVAAADLLQVPDGAITEQGLRDNLRIGVRYLESWLRGHGCVPLYDLMEDAATAEISRTQVWQWLHHKVELDDGRTVDADLVSTLTTEEMARVRNEIGDEAFDGGRFELAQQIFHEMVSDQELAEFLTVRAYQHI